MKLTKEQIDKLNDYLIFTSMFTNDEQAKFQAIAHVFKNATPSEREIIKIAWEA